MADADFADIATLSLKLETLNLSFSKIGDTGFKNILGACTALKKLDLSSCSGITVDGLNAIPKLVPGLRTLRFQSKAIGSKICAKDLEPLQNDMADLRIEGASA